MDLLFIHGAGGYEDDGPLAEALGAALGATVTMPRLPDEDMTVATWAATARAALDHLGTGGLAVGHSFGATILLRVLGAAARKPARTLLLAMPDWTPDGWDIPDYAFGGPEPAACLSLHHCRDDDVVPFGHLALHAARLPSARVVEHPRGGHQFDGRIDALVADALAH